VNAMYMCRGVYFAQSLILFILFIVFSLFFVENVFVVVVMLHSSEFAYFACSCKYARRSCLWEFSFVNELWLFVGVE